MGKYDLIVGIDVGTAKICSVIAEAQSGEIQLLGTGVAPSRGLKKGVVVNLSETINSIKQSLDLAEKHSETSVESAFVSLGGAYVRSQNSSGQTEVRNRSGEIDADDIRRAVSDARQLKFPENYQLIHVLTQNFTVDGQEGIVDPIGMFGSCLGVNLHVVVNASAVVRNIVQAINKADVAVEALVLQQLASAEAILSEDEKDLGTFVIDIGGGTTDIAAYSQGSIWHSEVLPMGGHLITKDIAITLKTPVAEAENLKIEVGSVYPESIPHEEFVEVSEVGSARRRTVSRRQLCQVIQARCDQILKSIAEIVAKTGLNTDLMTGVVLTGGGALMDGLADRVEQFLQMPARIGYPLNLVNQDDESYHPSYATALGLLRYANDLRNRKDNGYSAIMAAPSQPAKRGRMTNWIVEKIG